MRKGVSNNYQSTSTCIYFYSSCLLTNSSTNVLNVNSHSIESSSALSNDSVTSVNLKSNDRQSFLEGCKFDLDIPADFESTESTVLYSDLDASQDLSTDSFILHGTTTTDMYTEDDTESSHSSHNDSLSFGLGEHNDYASTLLMQTIY